MSRRAVVLLLVALCLGAAALAPKYVGLPSGSGSKPALRVTVPPHGSLQPSVTDRLARIDGRLRLPPDQRVLDAIGEIQRLAGAGAAAPAEASYSSGSWKVTREGRQVGLLSLYPTFGSLLSLLDESAASAKKSLHLSPDTTVRGELQNRLRRFDDATAFEILSKVDADWRAGRATVGDLLAATDALAQLCVILPSDFPASDRIAARALASLSLARLYAPERSVRAEAYLAYATGYRTHARSLAERLPKGDPLDAFLRHDLEALERAEKRPDRDPETDFLYGLLLSQAGSSERWLEWLQHLSRERAWRTAIVGTALGDGGLETGKIVPELYSAVLLTKFGVPLAQTETPARVLTHCDELASRVEKASAELTGPFADAELHAGAYRSACLSAVYHKLDFFMQTFGSPDAAVALARSLPSPARPDLQALRDWTDLVASTGAQHRNPEELAKALKAASALGPIQRRTLADVWIDTLPSDDPRRFDAADALAAWLDSRGLGRSFAGDLAMTVYFDPDLGEQLYGAALDLDGVDRVSLAVWLAGFRRDWAAAWSIAESDEASLDERMAALAGLRDQTPLDEPRLRRAYEALLAKHPESESLRRSYAACLSRALGDRVTARKVLAPVVAAHPEPDMTSDMMAAVLARMDREDGNAAAAWARLEPHLDGMVGEVLRQSVGALIELGDLQRAEQVARAEYQRYPGSLSAAADVSSVLWSAKRNREAAEVIAKFPSAASDDVRCRVFCFAFVRAFKGKPSAEAEAAFKELVAAKLGYQLLQGTIDSFRVWVPSEAETAFALGNLMDFPDGIFQVHTESYKSLKLARGEDAAIAWIATKIPKERLGAAAKIFYFRDADELLWKLIDDPDRDGGSATWLLRAAAFAREPKPDPTHRQALATYFGAHQQTFDEQLGAALTGLVDGAALLGRARNEAELAEAAYFLGTRAEGARDLHAAMRLYRLALSAHQPSPARAMALEAVTRIHRRDASLDAIAVEPEKNELVAGS